LNCETRGHYHNFSARATVIHETLTNFLQAGNSSPGVLLVPQRLPVGEAIEELVLIWAASDADEWRNRILRIPLP